MKHYDQINQNQLKLQELSELTNEIKKIISYSIRKCKEEKKRQTSQTIGNILSLQSQIISKVHQGTYDEQKATAKFVYDQIVIQIIDFIRHPTSPITQLEQFNSFINELKQFSSKMDIAHDHLKSSGLIQLDEQDNFKRASLWFVKRLILIDQYILSALMKDLQYQISQFVLQQHNNECISPKESIKQFIQNLLMIEQQFFQENLSKEQNFQQIYEVLKSTYEESHLNMIRLLRDQSDRPPLEWIAKAASIYQKYRQSHNFLGEQNQIKQIYMKSLQDNFLQNLKQIIIDKNQIFEQLNQPWFEQQQNYMGYLVEIFGDVPQFMNELSILVKRCFQEEGKEVIDKYKQTKIQSRGFIDQTLGIRYGMKFIRKLFNLTNKAPIINIKDIIRDVVINLLLSLQKEGLNIQKGLDKYLKRSLKRQDFPQIYDQEIQIILNYMDDIPQHFSIFLKNSISHLIRGSYSVQNLKYLCDNLIQTSRCSEAAADFLRLIRDYQTTLISDTKLLLETKLLREFIGIKPNNSHQEILHQAEITERNYNTQPDQRPLTISFELSSIEVSSRQSCKRCITIKMSVSQYTIIKYIESKGGAYISEIEQEYQGIPLKNIVFDLKQFQNIGLIWKQEDKFMISDIQEGPQLRQYLILKPYVPKSFAEAQTPDTKNILKAKIVRYLKQQKSALYSEILEHLIKEVKFEFTQESFKQIIEKLIDELIIKRHSIDTSRFIYT